MKQQISNIFQTIRCWAWKAGKHLRFKVAASKKVIHAFDLYPEMQHSVYVNSQGRLMSKNRVMIAPIVGVLEWKNADKLRAGVPEKNTVLDFAIIFNPHTYVENE